ncbi:MAG: hypothetical protein C4575_03890 [Desulforudis sp.]|jgi:hypothetical protein|nr:MAG: hypothetical protein C4575_03890 [Desulforudis sp.]
MDQCDFNEPESTNPSTAEIGVGMGLFNLTTFMGGAFGPAHDQEYRHGDLCRNQVPAAFWRASLHIPATERRP